MILLANPRTLLQDRLAKPERVNLLRVRPPRCLRRPSPSHRSTTPMRKSRLASLRPLLRDQPTKLLLTYSRAAKPLRCKKRRMQR